MKRFTEALKWRDPWFRGLSVDGKLAFFYLVDNCDAAGVWEPDFQLANFCLHRDIDWDTVRQEFGDRIVILAGGKWWIRKFPAFQYGILSDKCAPHKTVIACSLRHGLVVVNGSVTLPIPYQTPTGGVKEKEEDKDKEKGLFGNGTWGTNGQQHELPQNPGVLALRMEDRAEFPKEPLQRRAEMLFRRRETTVWDGAEKRAWEHAKHAVAATSEEDWQLLEWWFALPGDVFRRRDLSTLLNNWNAEIDRARAHQQKVGARRNGGGDIYTEPSGWREKAAKKWPGITVPDKWDDLPAAMRNDLI